MQAAPPVWPRRSIAGAEPKPSVSALNSKGNDDARWWRQGGPSGAHHTVNRGLVGGDHSEARSQRRNPLRREIPPPPIRGRPACPEGMDGSLGRWRTHTTTCRGWNTGAEEFHRRRTSFRADAAVVCGGANQHGREWAREGEDWVT
jgi:hypothetical protein